MQLEKVMKVLDDPLAQRLLHSPLVAPIGLQRNGWFSACDPGRLRLGR